MYKAVWVSLGIIIAVLLPFFLILLIISTKDSFITWQKIDQYVSKNEKNISQIYTEIYPKAFDCEKFENKRSCQTIVAQEIQQKLLNFAKVEFNQGVYFVEVRSGKMYKLFQDGEAQSIPVSIRKQVALWAFAHLKLSSLSTMRILSDPIFRFFGDFHSEAELIIPISSGFSEVRVVVVPYGD